MRPIPRRSRQHGIVHSAHHHRTCHHTIDRVYHRRVAGPREALRRLPVRR